MGGLPRLLLTIFNCTGVAGHQSSASPNATWRPTASSARTISSVNTMPTQFLAWNAETQPCPTHCARYPISPLAVGRGCIIQLPQSSKALRRTRTPRSSRPSSRSTGRAPTKSSHLPPVPPLTPKMAPPSALSSYILDRCSNMPGADARRGVSL